MEEDVMGTMRTVHASAYAACSRCATMTPVQEMHLVSSTALDALSEYEQLCPACYTALVAGEQELPPAEP